MTGASRLFGISCVATLAAVGAPRAAVTADVAAGQALYRAACQSCHGEEGKGDGPASADMPLNPRDFGTGQFKFDTDADGSWSDADLKNVIRNGAAVYGGSPLMAPWLDLPDSDLDNLIAFIRSLER